MKMFQVNLLIASLCCLAFFNNFAQCSMGMGENDKDDTSLLRPTTYSLKNWMTKDRSITQRENLKKFQQKGSSHRPEHHFSTDTIPRKNFEAYKPLSKNSHALNKKMLSKLGFIKVKAPNSHHRKRLAVESRRHTSPDDSHMFIIKLPPNFIYYTNPKAEANSNPDVKTNTQKVSTFPFSSNGKPGRIYHWNLPVLQKILGSKQSLPHNDINGKKYVINFKKLSKKPWENDSIEKSYKSNYKKSLTHKSPSYYAPNAAVNRNSFNRYFSGNGKPKGFYVIKENSKKDIHYKNIVP